MWYKDRDFPEVKSSNSDIVAVIEDQRQLDRVINDHNALEERIVELNRQVNYWKEDSSTAWDTCEDRRVENLELSFKLKLAEKCIKAHDTWHIKYDEYDGYTDSELSQMTDDTLSEIREDLE